jgi:hypothetical protein
MGREDKDGQRGHIIGPSWVLQWALHASDRAYNNIQNLILLFCDWGRQIKPSLYFLGDTGS